jgi:RHS repeat-associated protein
MGTCTFFNAEPVADFYQAYQGGQGIDFVWALSGSNRGRNGEGKNNGKPCDRCAGDPIDLSTGNEFMEENDYAMSPSLARYYNSQDTGSGHFGSNWRHTYDEQLLYLAEGSPGGVTAILHKPDGKDIGFDKTNGTWAPDSDVSDTLQEVDGPAGTPISWIFFNSTLQRTDVFDNSGLWTSSVDQNGHTLALTYSDASTPTSIAPQTGLLLSVTDEKGRLLQFSYNQRGLVSAVTLPDGSHISYTYDYPIVALLSATYADNTSRNYIYNQPSGPSGNYSPSQLTAVIDENGVHTRDIQYDPAGRATHTEEGNGANPTTVTYNGASGVTVQYGSGSTADISFQTIAFSNKKSGVSNPCGTSCGERSKSSTYDANGYQASSTDFNNVTTTTTYSSDGLLEEKVEALGLPEKRTSSYVWDHILRVPLSLSIRNNGGSEISRSGWSYNARGQVVASCEIDPAIASSYTCSTAGTPPQGVRRTVNTYCDAVSASCPVIGLLLTSDGPRTDIADITTYAYYATSSATSCGTPGSSCHQAGDLHTIQDALGHTTTYTSYDGAGRVTRITDPNGTNTDITYDPRGRVLTRSYGGATTTYGYDPVGNLTQVTDPDNVVTHYTYDAAHRLTDVTDALGNHIHYTLDNAGNKTAENVYDANNTVKRSIGRTFNTLGQLTALRDGLNNTVLNAGFTDSYDANGNQVHTADALGIQRQSSFDSLNRLITTLDNYNGTDPATQNTTTRYGYDAKDNLVQVTDPSNLVTTYTLDGLDNQTALASPDTGTATATFDAAGNQLTRTDARGIVATSTYDALNRIVSTTYADTSLNVAYHYDEVNATTGCPASQPLGRLTRVVEAAVTTTYCYDGRGNVTRKMQTQGAVTDTAAMAYTNGDRLQSLTYPSGTIVSYTRDANGQIVAATLTPTGGTAASAVSSVSYLPFGPVLSYTLGNGQQVTRTYDANYAFTDVVSPALAIHIARDAVGNVVALGNAPGANPATETYGYDPLYRLTDVVDGISTAQAFTYNATGDRLSKAGAGLATGTYSYVTGTHRLAAIGTGARATDANGNTTASVTAGQDFGFGYNGRNRMIVAQASSQTIGTYRYTAAGERISKTTVVPISTTERFVYGRGKQLIAEYGTTNSDYIWIDDLPIAVADNTGANASVSYVHADGLNTPRAVSNLAGSTIWQWQFSANVFGETQPTGSYILNLRFPGQYYDAETGLNYNVSRDYDASVGRYLQSDPIGLQGGISTYGYVSANPLIHSDLLGLAPGDQWWEFTNRAFQRWYHLCWKEKGAPDATREELAEAYAEWTRRGSPSNGKCFGDPPPCPDKAPTPYPKPDSAVRRALIAIGLAAAAVAGFIANTASEVL